MNAIASLYSRRIRGFRVVNFAFVIVLFVLMFGLYFAKTRASGDSASIARTERQIVAEHRNIRLLQAKVANLEQPDNITRLSTYVGLAPISATHEIDPGKLAEVAAGRHAAPVAPPAPAVAPPAAAPQVAPKVAQ